VGHLSALVERAEDIRQPQARQSVAPPRPRWRGRCSAPHQRLPHLQTTVASSSDRRVTSDAHQQQESQSLNRNPATRYKERGFSLVEAMVAALLLLMIAVGILPLFVGSIVNNAQGQDSSTAANFARARLEEFDQLPFDDARLQIVAGTERQFDEIYLFKAKKWIDGTVPPAGDWALWSRTTLVHQYGAKNFEDAPYSWDTRLPSSAAKGDIHLKEVEVTVRSNRNQDATGPSLGAGKTMSARLYKSA
jgi:type II secretory pathway pseudopilin PulG